MFSFLFRAPFLCSMWKHGGVAWDIAWPNEKMNMENHCCSTYMYLFSVDYSILSYFLFLFSFSLLYSVIVPFIIIIISNWHTFLPSFIYLTRSVFCCGFFDIFFLLFPILFLSLPPCGFLFVVLVHPLHGISFGYIHCMSVFLSSSYFLFPSPKLLPFHSIGTREVVTQKNLCGLVPIRDFRLDPSLLYSIPLLALSPNLLIVWLFLSIAYLVARLRCK